MNLYYKIIYLFLDKEIYNKYKTAFDINSIKGSLPLIYKIFVALTELHARTTNSQNSCKDLETVFYSLYPGENPKELNIVFQHIEKDGQESNKELLFSYLNDCQTRSVAYEIARLGITTSDGHTTPEAFKEGLKRALADLEVPASTLTTEFISDDLETLYNETVKAPGLRWRLESLNKTLGSLRTGDFGFIFARPETGKTTFLASEGTYMASQLTGDQGPLLWINNEEQGNKVMIRCYQAALDKTLKEISADLKGNKDLFAKLIQGKIKLFDKGKVSAREIDNLVATLKPSLIIIDQIDKIEGFSGDREDLKLGNIYMWARDIAKDVCPVIGVCQADGTGEGVKALNMSHVANAKTAKQAEADFILGIGKTHNKDEEFIRYFNISKNKLFGDEDTDPSRKHDFWEVEIDPQHARYRDFVYHDYSNP